METVDQLTDPAVEPLLSLMGVETPKSTLTNAEMLLQTILIGTVFRMSTGIEFTKDMKLTKEDGAKMMDELKKTIDSMVEGDEARTMMLMAVITSFLSFKNAAMGMAKMAEVVEIADNKTG
jgi:hypothetical protein